MEKTLKWFLRKEQIKNLLEIPENQDILNQKISVSAELMVWGWGAKIVLEGDQGSKLSVPYFQEEVERPQEELDIINGFDHHLKNQLFLLKELLEDLKKFMEDEFQKTIEIQELD